MICTSQSRADDMNKSFEEIVKGYGYPFEQHYITTKDGYILKLFRIPHERIQNKKDDNPRPPILLQHGIFDSSDFSVVHGPEKSITFVLANFGYDVWVANARGNKHSRQHKTLNPDKDKAFWDFSFFEMIEDYKANIEHIIQETGYKKIGVLGHSQGTSTMYSALSTQNEWFEERVSIFIALGSVSRLDHMTTQLLKYLIEFPIVLKTVKELGIEEMFPFNWIVQPVFKTLCGLLPKVWMFGNRLIADADPSVDDVESARILFGHFPSGTSTKCLEHYSQIYLAKNFQQFDYGKSENMKRYGSEIPPEFNLKSIKVPIAKFTGDSDELGDVEDNKWLSEQISQVLVFDKIYKYGHLTFFIGKDMCYLDDVKKVLLEHYPPGKSTKDNVQSLISN